MRFKTDENDYGGRTTPAEGLAADDAKDHPIIGQRNVDEGSVSLTIFHPRNL